MTVGITDDRPHAPMPDLNEPDASCRGKPGGLVFSADVIFSDDEDRPVRPSTWARGGDGEPGSDLVPDLDLLDRGFDLPWCPNWISPTGPIPPPCPLTRS